MHPARDRLTLRLGISRGSCWQLREAAPTGSHPSVVHSAGIRDLPPGVSLHSHGFGFAAALAALSASLRGERSSEWAGRSTRDNGFLNSPSGDSPGKQTSQSAVGDRARSQVYRGPPPLLPAWRSRGSGSPSPLHFLPPPPPSVQGRGMGSRSVFLRPGLTLPAPPGRPASDEPLASVQALVWPRPALQRDSGEPAAAGLEL